VSLDRYEPVAGSKPGTTAPKTVDTELASHDSRLTARITAKAMRWAGDRWEWQDGVAWRFAEDRETATPFTSLVPGGLTLRPEDIERPERKPEEMSYAELRRTVERKRLVGVPAGKERGELQLKIAFPFASLIMVLFGAPLAASLRRTGRGATFGLCLLLSFIFYGAIKGCQALGWNGLLPPALAAWLPNLLFAGVGGTIFLRAHE